MGTSCGCVRKKKRIWKDKVSPSQSRGYEVASAAFAMSCRKGPSQKQRSLYRGNRRASTSVVAQIALQPPRSSGGLGS